MIARALTGDPDAPCNLSGIAINLKFFLFILAKLQRFSILLYYFLKVLYEQKNPNLFLNRYLDYQLLRH